MKGTRMKSLFAGAMVVLLLAVAIPAIAVTVTNQGQVITVTLMSENVAAASISRTYAPALGCQIDSNAVTVATAYTPRDLGDVLIGRIATATNAAWIAMGGVTSNSWIRFAPAPTVTP